MITYATLHKSPRKFLSMTSLTVAEFNALLPIFAEEYMATNSPTHTRAGRPRQRTAGGGNKPRLACLEDKLLFILVYQKTYPLQTAQGLKQMPERDPQALAHSPALSEVAPDLIIDGTERRRQRPKNAEKQREYYSGKKKRTPRRT